MPQVGDGVDAERALRALDEEAMLVEHGEDRANMAQVLRQQAAVD